MKNKLGFILLGIFLIIGFGLRLYHLTEVPQGFNWDEAANGYNAYSLLQTGKDEFGKPWPLFMKSFGEYKSGTGIIMLVPILKLLGLSVFSVRLQTVLFGCLFILASFFLALKFFKKSLPASLVAGLIAISPWAIHTSRFSLEWYLGLPLLVFGLSLLVDENKKNWKIPLAAILLSFSLYFYGNIKLFLPLILLAYVVIYRKNLKENLKVIFLGFILGLLTLLPLFKAMEETDWLARSRQVSMINNEDLGLQLNEGLYRHSVSNLPFIRVFNNKPLFYGKEFIVRYLNHFSPEFLFAGKDVTPRLEIEKVGKLYLISLPFLIIGIAESIRKRRKIDKFLITWLAMAPIASSLTVDSPHGLRAIIMMPILQIFTVQGLVYFYKAIQAKTKPFRVISIIFIVVLYLGGLSYFLWRYFLFYSEETAIHWLDGHKELVEKINYYRPQFNKIIFTTHYGQPHIFFAFFSPTNPIVYQHEVVGQQNIFNAYITHLDGVEFKAISNTDYCMRNTLIIDHQAKEGVNPIDKIYIKNKFHEPKIVFELYDTNDPKIKEIYCSKID